MFLSKKPYYLAVLLLFFALLSSGGAYYWYKERHPITLVIKKTDIRADIRAPGRIIVSGSIDLGFGADGRISDIFVKQGDKVGFGDRLAQLDTDKLRAEIKQYQSEIETDKLKLSQSLSGMKAGETALAESRTNQAKIALESARQELEDLQLKTENDLSEKYALALDYSNAVLLAADNAVKALGGIYAGNNKFIDIFVVADSQKKSEAEWQVMFARSALDNIKMVRESLEKDSSRKNIDQALAQFKINLELIRSALQKTAEIFETATMAFGAPDIATFKTTVAVQRSNINSSQTAVLTMEQNIASAKIAAQVAINKARRNIESLESALKTAENELALKRAAPRDAEIIVYQAQIKENESRIAVLESRLKESVIKAPSAGVVGFASKKIGSFAKAGEPVISFASFSDVEAEARLSVSDADRVRAGDPAFVMTEYGDYRGKVIGLNGDTARVYLEDDNKQLPPDVTASVRIQSIIKSNVILVPKSFIYDEDGVKKVSLFENNGKKPLGVVVGMEWGDQIEIEEGVSEGDTIAL